jgi:hypothetical protein
MNRNPDRTPLTTDQLRDLARQCGMSDADLDAADGVHQKETAIRSFLLERTRKLRFDMCMRGELVLDTSGPFVPKPKPPLTVDRDVVDFLTRSRARV